MKSDPPRVRALRRQLTATFYRKNKATFFVTAGAMLLLGGALLAVAWILQQIIDIASGDSVAPLVRMCWLCLGVLVSVTTIYVVQCYTYPAFLRRNVKLQNGALAVLTLRDRHGLGIVNKLLCHIEQEFLHRAVPLDQRTLAFFKSAFTVSVG